MEGWSIHSRAVKLPSRLDGEEYVIWSVRHLYQSLYGRRAVVKVEPSTGSRRKLKVRERITCTSSTSSNNETNMSVIDLTSLVPNASSTTTIVPSGDQKLRMRSSELGDGGSGSNSDGAAVVSLERVQENERYTLEDDEDSIVFGHLL
ncbi:hypothetical protein BYT27DRAFT_7218528 [Phlegmacium glaucopus]|nr:hypothetical protein BYT27DRAFT_7218528 [Phlegmacium glaucopus]